MCVNSRLCLKGCFLLLKIKSSCASAASTSSSRVSSRGTRQLTPSSKRCHSSHTRIDLPDLQSLQKSPSRLLSDLPANGSRASLNKTETFEMKHKHKHICEPFLVRHPQSTQNQLSSPSHQSKQTAFSPIRKTNSSAQCLFSMWLRMLSKRHQNSQLEP